MSVPQVFLWNHNLRRPIKYTYGKATIITGKKISCCAIIKQNQALSPRFYRILMVLDEVGSECFRNLMPGQFAEFDLTTVSLPNYDKISPELKDVAYKHIILRRPLSFAGHGIIDGKVHLEVLYCVLGPATLRMTTLREGDTLNLIGPLGNGFSIPAGKKTALLVAGGMGAPPLQHMAAYLVKKHPDIKPYAFAGARSFADLPYFKIENSSCGTQIAEFARHGIESCVATDDGSFGHKGFVTQALAAWLNENKPNPSETIIYACGPEPMMAAISRLAQSLNIDCQVSLERMMACGIGICQSCAVQVKTREEAPKYKLCCKDGPVFDSREVIFE